MNQEHVDIVEAKVFQLLLAGPADVLLLVVSAPELGGDKEILALDKTVLDSHGDTLSDGLLVLVVAGAVNQTVADLDRVVDCLGSILGVDFPAAETNHGHLVTGRLESNVFDGHLANIELLN